MGSKASRHKSTSNKKSLADHSCYYAVQTNSTTQHSFSVRFVEDEDEHTANNNSIKSTSSWMELFESTPAFILDCCSLRNDFTNSFENSEFKSYPSIRKVLSGSRHLFIWMEDDEEMSQTLVTRKTTTTTTCRMNAKDENDHFDDKVLIKVCHALFACGENEYAQCGCTFSISNTFSTIQKVDLNIPLSDCSHLPENDLQLLRKLRHHVWKLKNVYTTCNYSFFHIFVESENDYINKYELLIGSGWNNVGCCGVGDTSSTSVKRKIVLFHYDGKNSAFLPKHEQISLVSAGGCNSILVSWNSLTQSQQLYMCGETIEHIYGNNYTNHAPREVFSLHPLFMNQFILLKENQKQSSTTITTNSSQKRTIQKVHAAYGSSHFLLSDHSLLSFGYFALTTGQQRTTPHWIHSDHLNGESIKDFVAYESHFALLTYEGNIWVPTLNEEDSLYKKTLKVFEFGPGSISRICLSLNYDGVVVQCQDNNLYILSSRPSIDISVSSSLSSSSTTLVKRVKGFKKFTTNTATSNTTTIEESNSVHNYSEESPPYLSHLTMTSFLQRHPNVKSKKMLQQLSTLVLEGNAQVSIHGLHGLFLVFQVSQKKKRAKKQLCQNLWNQWQWREDNSNTFVDVMITWES
nr:unnamed protein product [Naegleria fowleri]